MQKRYFLRICRVSFDCYAGRLSTSFPTYSIIGMEDSPLYLIEEDYTGFLGKPANYIDNILKVPYIQSSIEEVLDTVRCKGFNILGEITFNWV